ncbi:hypothetical protein [Frateuria aurantia]|uniref:Uncharacterized protein n=1 Tax=Frateuria aurantia (strain ATCC 33424 / DSM 6220 / KCTC 2777 / LMG 1558 / NBRC 3245 / NCIMB 13370) TaxID=767434 RepID=H8L5X3_FRAAD|nr:hypothetical protein [Frateuria aurantia]AFC85871.1 hypothetical protein Fraau_1447 [Frateuria aurantia DSM 6220]
MTDRIKWGEPVTGWDGVIAAAQGMKNGKKVQCWMSDSWCAWGKNDHLHASDKYRISEEVSPREFWVNLYFDGEIYICDSKESADQGADNGCIECIHVREVIE